MMQSSHQITQAQSGVARIALGAPSQTQLCICLTVQLEGTAEKELEKWT